MIGSLIQLTLANPRAAIRAISELHLPRAVLWQGLLAVVLISVLAIEVNSRINPPPAGTPEADMIRALLDRPLVLALAEGSALVIMVFAVFWVGRMFGGTARFDQAIATVAWMQVIMLMVQLVQLVLLTLAPGLSALVFLLAVGFYFWLLTQFVSEIHGFNNPFAVFAGILATMIGAIIGLSVFITLILMIFLGGAPNV